MARPIALSLLALVASMAACDETSEVDTPVDTGADPVDVGPTDNGVPETDLGTPDTGTPDLGTPDMGFDCSMNPNGCVENQRLDAMCGCLPDCEDGFRWNPVTMVCDMEPAGECAVDADCTGSDAVCLNPPAPGGSFTTCTGEETCQCFTSCNPFVSETRTGCPAGQACAHLLTEGLNADAICVAPGMGRTQGAECTPAVTCNRNSNHFCIGASTTSTVPGVCQRLCDAADDTFCNEQAAGLVCNPANVQGFPTLGLCGNPPVPITDFGQTCVDSSMCAGLCSQILAGCTAACRAPSTCPMGAECINFTGAPPGESSICMVACSSADNVGDIECQARNTFWVCRDLVANLSPLCSPPCSVIGCPAARPTCNAQTGRCE